MFISVYSEIKITPAHDCCSAYSYSDPSSLYCLYEEEVDKPSDCNNKDVSSRKQAKKTAIEKCSDSRKYLCLGMDLTEEKNPTCKSLPVDDACPPDELVAKLPSQTNEPSSKVNAYAVAG